MADKEQIGVVGVGRMGQAITRHLVSSANLMVQRKQAVWGNYG